MEEVTLKKLPRSLVACEMTVPPEEVAGAEARALKKIGADFEIRGFRKGKVPAEMVRKTIGEAKLFEEASFLVIEEKYAEMIKKIDIRVVGRPRVEIKKIAPGNPLVFAITMTVYPEVMLPDYKKIAHELGKERKPAVVEDKDVHSALEWLLESRRKETRVLRPARRGDFVEINFESRIGGVKVDGGESRNHPLVLGKSKFAEGFDAQLEGMSEGQKKEFSLSISAEHGRVEIRGKQVDFSVKMNMVREIILPELNDEFARSLGQFQDIRALKENIQEGLKEEKGAQEKEAFHTLVAKTIAGKAKAEIADILIEEETDKMLKETEHGLSERGLGLDAYLSSIKKTKEEMRKDFLGEAESRVKIALTLEEIAKKENVSVSADELKERTERILRRQTESERQTVDVDLLSRYVSGIIRNEKVFALLENI